MKTSSPQSKGGRARAAKLSPIERKKIASNAASKRWEADSVVAQWSDASKSLVRAQIAGYILQGLYANIEAAQKYAVAVSVDKTREIPVIFAFIALDQADELLKNL